MSSNLTITKHFKPLDPKNLAHSVRNHIRGVVSLFCFIVAKAVTKLVTNWKFLLSQKYVVPNPVQDL